MTWKIFKFRFFRMDQKDFRFAGGSDEDSWPSLPVAEELFLLSRLTTMLLPNMLLLPSDFDDDADDIAEGLFLVMLVGIFRRLDFA